MNHAEPELLYHRKMLGFLEHDLPEAQKEVDIQAAEKNNLTLKLRQIELQHSEMSLRLEETEAELRLRD